MLLQQEVSNFGLEEVILFQPPVRRLGTAKRKRSRFFVVGIGFVALLLLPLLDQLFGLSAGFQSTEKRILTPMPTWQFPHVRTYAHQFEQYFNENFGWRNALFYQYSHWKYGVMGASPLPEKVVVGKHGWFYPGNSLARVADQHRGLAPVAPATLEAIARRLTQYQQELANQGTQLYLMIAPDSYTIYPEHLPDHVRATTQPSNFDQLKKHLSQHTSIPFVDVRTALWEAKRRHAVYRPTDTHWNDYGSLIATLTLTKRIRQDFPELPKARLLNYGVRTVKGTGGDLVTMLALNRKITDSVDYQIKPIARLAVRQTECIPSPTGGLPSQRFVSTNGHLPRLLLVGDSFSYNMNPFVPGYFSESYMVRTNQLNLDLIRKERPQVVVVEVVERNIALLTQL